MKAQSRELYRERTGWALWVYLLIWVSMGGSALAVLLGMDSGSDMGSLGRILAALGLVLAALVLHVVFGGLTVVLDAEGVRVGLGMGWPFRTRIEYDEIASLESVTYSPLREFGGWGLRGSSTKRAWTARGDRAVRLHLHDGRLIYLGSDQPSRLEGRIRNAMLTAGVRTEPPTA